MADCFHGRVQMRSIIVCLAAVSAVAAFELADRAEDPCADVFCKAGRECIVANGIGMCHCQSTCPDTFTPVCGTDGKSYDNHCVLHRHACLTETRIGIQHKGFCKNKKKVKEPVKPSVKEEDPAVCYSSQRDALLLVIGKHWQKTLATQPWHVSGMTYRESLWGRFFTCDEDRDKFLESDELLNCTKDAFFMARPEQNQELTRALCIDAIVDAADENKDWRLDFEEFTAMLSPGWHPPQKLCSLEGKTYHDAHEVVVDGNRCVCAVGSWVCTNPARSDAESKKEFKKDDFYSYDDGENELDGGKDDAADDGDKDDDDAYYDDYYYDDYEDAKKTTKDDAKDTKDDGDDDDDDDEYIDKLFDDLLVKLRKHRREKHHHNHL
ncbi:follistatin-related protein 1-like isoform X1 [Macrobrachium rosenbergii]|uniref:follistatin-related protein 1-like isoform X1 n=2 Tax=Macrobrachium rosenbergii TaxID=79674 RepID=UPI0034D542AE